MSRRPPYLQQPSEDDSNRSEMFVEEIDPDYEPDDEEIRQTAVQSLGMKLPQDNDFLYLAREALKAPLPDSWNVFQSRTGEVYYKHAVTQQKVYEHPVDVQYRKRYQEQKEKVARRSAKSKSKPAGVMKLLGNIAQSEDAFNTYTQQSYDDNISNNASRAFMEGLDSKYEKEIQTYEKEQKKMYQDFRNREEREFRDRQNKERDRHENQMRMIKNKGSAGETNTHESLKKEKEKITKQLEEKLQDDFNKEIRDFDEQLERDRRKTETISDAEYKHEATEYRQKLDQKFDEKQRYLQVLEKDLIEEARLSEHRKKEQAKEAQATFERKKRQFDEEAQAELQKEIEKQKKIRAARVQDKFQQLEADFLRIKKTICKSPEDSLREWVQKKSRLEEMSRMKYQAHKALEMQGIQREMKQHLEQQKAKRLKKLEDNFQSKCSIRNVEEDAAFKKKMEAYATELKTLIEEREAEIYADYKNKFNQFQLRRNSGLINARNQFLEQIQVYNDTASQQVKDASNKLMCEHKQFQIENKTKMIQALRVDARVLQNRLNQHQLDRRIYRNSSKSEEIDKTLKEQLGAMRKRQPLGTSPSAAEPKSNLVLRQHEELLNAYQSQLEEDKVLLDKVYSHIQSTGMQPFYDKARILRNYELPTDVQQNRIRNLSSGNNELIRLYNADVRTLRENQKMIQEYKRAVALAETDEAEAIHQLHNLDRTYSKPVLKDKLVEGLFLNKPVESSNRAAPIQNNFVLGSSDLVSTKRATEMFKQHSRFLSNVKMELNSKLAQLKGLHYSTRFY